MLKTKPLKILAVFLWISTSALAFEESAEVKRVIDGESLELTDGRVVRMIGVAATNVRPILMNRLRATPEQMAGMPVMKMSEEVAAYIEKNILGRNIILSYDPSYASTSNLDPQGRILAYVWYSLHYKAKEGSEEYSKKIMGIQSEDRLLNSEIIRLGLAFVDTQTSFLQQDLFLRFERDAAKSKKGVWQSWEERYNEIFGKAKSSRAGSVSDLVSDDVRELSLQSARRSFNELVSANPNNWQSYYERSWLGADILHDKAGLLNLADIDQAISLSAVNPILYQHRHFLLRLFGRHEEALAAYERAVELAAKLGMPTELTEMLEEDLTKGYFDFLGADRPHAESGLAREALRAIYNEDHFLIFMARTKGSEDASLELIQALYQNIQSRGQFQNFYEKHKDLIEKGAANDLLYQTQWAVRGLDAPEEVLQWMESFGFAAAGGKEKSKDEKTAKASGPRPGPSQAVRQAVQAQRA